LTTLYSHDELYRSRVVMARHGFGRGEYKYYGYPLPEVIGNLRDVVYPHLVPIANRWNEIMRIDTRYPPYHAEFIDRCHAAGQLRPTPLILQYGEGDYNCLHQDLYGEHVFPLQLAILLSVPGRDFTGGEFVMTEQRPRMHARPLLVITNSPPVKSRPARQQDCELKRKHVLTVQVLMQAVCSHLRRIEGSAASAATAGRMASIDEFGMVRADNACRYA